MRNKKTTPELTQKDKIKVKIDDVIEYIITKEDDAAIEHLLSFLSHKEYSVMKLFLDGYSYKQIAEKLGITPKSADNALSRARKKLKALL